MLAACGGGGSPDQSKIPPPVTPVAEANGIYQGTDSNNDAIVGVILDTGVYYFAYTNSTSNQIGLVQGTSTSSGGTFKSTDAKNFYIAQNTVLNDTVSANYTAKSNITGTIAPASGNGAGITFTGTYNALYDQTPSFASLAGTYAGAGGSVKGGEPITLTVAADGSFTGKGPSGCTFKGLTAPHNGKNVFDATIVFGGAPCTYPGSTIVGIAVQNNNELIAAAALPDRSDAFLVVASK
ncbi:hypothetical protein [Caballeronia sp. LZ043]|uniref:hypothetical protein n=1 Tax=Caballeronia sp. LZ043 TaxID=3038569 RepID=UPI0028679AD6|nr:hypothetical protein [Caballeronia sp. LZ043]MDR5821965.1 hypothetical protein [Caballeronia sp. LZ043]